MSDIILQQQIMLKHVVGFPAVDTCKFTNNSIIL